MGGRRSRAPYQEGQWFAVPVQRCGYGLGVIVRSGPRSHGGLGYFFGPTRDSLPGAEVTDAIRPEDAVLVTWFGFMGLIEGRWPLVACSRRFSRSEWPIPKFRRRDILDTEMAWMVEYDPDATMIAGNVIQETRLHADELSHLPEESLEGYIALEWILGKLLGAT
jgi:hypothetical protein